MAGMLFTPYFTASLFFHFCPSKYGVNSIPATCLLDGEGKILGKDLRGEELEKAVTAALVKK